MGNSGWRRRNEQNVAWQSDKSDINVSYMRACVCVCVYILCMLGHVRLSFLFNFLFLTQLKLNTSRDM